MWRNLIGYQNSLSGSSDRWESEQSGPASESSMSIIQMGSASCSWPMIRSLDAANCGELTDITNVQNSLSAVSTFKPCVKNSDSWEFAEAISASITAGEWLTVSTSRSRTRKKFCLLTIGSRAGIKNIQRSTNRAGHTPANAPMTCVFWLAIYRVLLGYSMATSTRNASPVRLSCDWPRTNLENMHTIRPGRPLLDRSTGLDG